MSRLRSPALVLRRWPFSEHSLVVHLLTPGHGSLSALAKGAYRLKSGFAGVLDTWSLVEVELGQMDKEGLHVLYRAQLLDRMTGLADDSRRLAVAGVLAELAEVGSPPGQEAHRQFLWLQRWLARLAEGWPADPSLVAALLEGLGELGLAPRLEPPEDGRGRRWFSPAHGGALQGPRPDELARPYPEALQEQLEALRARPQLARGLGGSEVVDSLTILGEFLQYHLERPPRAWSMLQGGTSRRARTTSTS